MWEEFNVVIRGDMQPAKHQQCRSPFKSPHETYSCSILHKEREFRDGGLFLQ